MMIPTDAHGFAKFWRAVWRDPNWSALSVDAVFLYTRLFSDPDVPMTGVLHWDPTEIARRFPDATVPRLTAAAAMLAERDYLLFDAHTREVMIRSYVRHAVTLRNQNLAKGLAVQFRRIESDRLRAVLVFELRRLVVDKPDWPWGYLSAVLAEPSADPADLHQMFE